MSEKATPTGTFTCRFPLLPQHLAEPSERSAQLWAVPLSTRTTRTGSGVGNGVGGTGVGVTVGAMVGTGVGPGVGVGSTVTVAASAVGAGGIWVGAGATPAVGGSVGSRAEVGCTAISVAGADVGAGVGGAGGKVAAVCRAVSGVLGSAFSIATVGVFAGTGTAVPIDCFLWSVFACRTTSSEIPAGLVAVGAWRPTDAAAGVGLAALPARKNGTSTVSRAIGLLLSRLGDALFIAKSIQNMAVPTTRAVRSWSVGNRLFAPNILACAWRLTEAAWRCPSPPVILFNQMASRRKMLLVVVWSMPSLVGTTVSTSPIDRICARSERKSTIWPST